jgi:uncharacterized membrane protein
MNATLAPSPWPAPSSAPRGALWTFGREIELKDLPGSPRALQWRLLRNCSLSPRALIQVYIALCMVSCVIAVGFFLQGATLVLAFAGIELLAVGVALLVFARHAADSETLTLVGRSLQVEQCFGRRVDRTDFAADWLTIEPAAGQGSLVEISSRGQSVRVGRFLRPELRAAFARELRLALRRAPVFPAAVAEAQNDSN